MEEQKQPKPKKTQPDNLVELYMDNRQGMLECPDEYSYYRRLMESISIGYAIIGDDNGFSSDIKNTLNNKDNYPKSRNMDYKSSTHIYTCSTGDGRTGKVTVRPEELPQGELSLRNQQANIIIQRLIPIDRKIFIYLINKGWIKKLSMKENIERDLIKDMADELHDELLQE